MKILAVADEESKYLWEYYEPSKLRDIDLIIGCGDLSLHYMNFLSDAAPVPVLYVHGNHDASYDREPPRGAICIDDDLYWYKGYRIVGLGGSCRYRAGAWQFTEAEMKRRISHLRSRIQHAGGVDILVTHAPLHGYGDFSDLPHRGFTAFSVLLDRYHPQLMLHGHILFSAESAAHRCNLRVLAFRCLQITHRLQVPLIEFLQAAVVERRMAENMRIARPAHALISLRAVGRNVDKVAFL